MNNSDLADLIDGTIESIDCYFDRWRTYCNRTYPADPLPPFDQEFKDEQHRDYQRLMEARTQALNAAKATAEAMALRDEDCAGLLRFHHFVSASNSHRRRGRLDMEGFRQSIGSLDGESGPEKADPLWLETKVSLQMISIRLRKPAGTPVTSPPTGNEPGEGGKPQPRADRQVRDPNKPGQDRQNDILAAITTQGMPLTRPELIEEMKLKSEGKLGHQLAWMVANNILLNIPQRGYWPVDRPVPE